MKKRTVTLYVVALNREEANELAKTNGWTSRTVARRHLEHVKAISADPDRAAKHHVYRVIHAAD